MSAYSIQLTNRRACAQENLRDVLLHLQRDSLCRRRPERRTAARDQTQNDVLLGQILQQVSRFLYRAYALRIRNRMSRLDETNAAQRQSASVLRNDQAAGHIIAENLLDH